MLSDWRVSEPVRKYPPICAARVGLRATLAEVLI